MAQTTPALIKPNTTEMLTVRVGIRNGKPVIVHSNIPLAYLPDSIISTESEFDYALREYGYETYCKIPTGQLAIDSPDEICFSNYEPIKDLSSKDLLLDSKK
jgi:hypothetical protein